MTKVWEKVPLEAPPHISSMDRLPAAFLLIVPFLCNASKSAHSTIGANQLAAGYAVTGVEPSPKGFSCGFHLLSCLCKTDVGVSPKGNQLLLAVETKFLAPALASTRRYQQMQPVAVSQLVVLLPRRSRSHLFVRKHSLPPMCFSATPVLPPQ